MLALSAALRTIDMVFNHASGYRRAPRWNDRGDRSKAGQIHAAMLDDLDEEDLRSILGRMAAFNNDPRAIDVVKLVCGEP